jgi:regulator of replication initiation timing
MENELQALESKLAQLIAVTRKLRSENQSLRQQLAQQVDDNKRTNARLDEAARRLESLLEQIPEA